MDSGSKDALFLELLIRTLVAADSDFEAGADGEGETGVTDGADVLLA